MNNWERFKLKYPTRLLLTDSETDHLHFLTTDSFAANVRGEQLIFALFGNEVLFSQGAGHTWRFEDDQAAVEEHHFETGYVNYQDVTDLDHRTGRARFRNRDIKYRKEDSH